MKCPEISAVLELCFSVNCLHQELSGIKALYVDMSYLQMTGDVPPLLSIVLCPLC